MRPALHCCPLASRGGSQRAPQLPLAQARPDVTVTAREVASAAGAAWRGIDQQLKGQYEARSAAEKASSHHPAAMCSARPPALRGPRSNLLGSAKLPISHLCGQVFQPNPFVSWRAGKVCTRKEGADGELER